MSRAIENGYTLKGKIAKIEIEQLFIGDTTSKSVTAYIQFQHKGSEYVLRAIPALSNGEYDMIREYEILYDEKQPNIVFIKEMI